MKKLNGYRASHRNKWMFIKEGILSVQELSLLEFYADIVDFDRKHDTYGLVEVNFNIVASIFRCSVNTIRNWHNSLLQCGFITKTENPHFYKLACHERYINPGLWGGKAAEYTKAEKDQPIGNILQSFGIDTQSVAQNIQQIENKHVEQADTKALSPSIAISSYKDDYQVNQHGGVIKSDKEYRELEVSGVFGSLTAKDMKWIDVNVKELTNVQS